MSSATKPVEQKARELLEPCPFCGGEPDLVLGTAIAYVRCMQADCEATGPTALRAHGDGEAERLWNARPSIAALNTDGERIRRDALEEAALVCEQQARDFLSHEYATPQPVGSITERFACKECADAIRSLSTPSKGVD